METASVEKPVQNFRARLEWVMQWQGQFWAWRARDYHFRRAPLDAALINLCDVVKSRADYYDPMDPRLKPLFDALTLVDKAIVVMEKKS